MAVVHDVERFQRVAFREGDLLVKTLDREEELMAAYRLRHKVYAEKLQWVPTTAEGLEIDGYDDIAASVGLFSSDQRLVGVIRLLESTGPFMLEREFKSCLLPGSELRKHPDTNEITRLTVDPDLERGLSSRAFQVLLKGLYQWLLANDVRYSYMVVEKRFLRILQLIGFPARAISPAISIPPAGAVSVAAILDWEEFRSENSRKRPEFLAWMSAVEQPAVFMSDEMPVGSKGDGFDLAPKPTMEEDEQLVAV
ncbi:acyl-homoserine-lactone synthase [Candidatus Nitrospira bockiana]